MKWEDVFLFIQSKLKFRMESNSYGIDVVPIYSEKATKDISDDKEAIWKIMSRRIDIVLSFLEEVEFDLTSVNFDIMKKDAGIREQHFKMVNAALLAARRACLEEYGDLKIKAVNNSFIHFLDAYRQVLQEMEIETGPPESSYVNVLRTFMQVFEFQTITPGPEKGMYTAKVKLPDDEPRMHKWIAIPDLIVKLPAPAPTNERNNFVLFTVESKCKNSCPVPPPGLETRLTEKESPQSDLCHWTNLRPFVAQHFMELLVDPESTVFKDIDAQHYYRLGLVQLGTRVSVLMLGVSKAKVHELLVHDETESNPIPAGDQEKNFFRLVCDYDLLKKDDRVKFATYIKQMISKLH